MSLKGSTKFDLVRRNAYLEALREGMARYSAARSVGVHPATVANYRKKHPAFGVEEAEAEVEAVEAVENEVYRMALTTGAPGQMKAAEMYLHSHAGAKWAARRDARVELTGAGGGPIKVESQNSFVRDVLASRPAISLALALLDEVAEADPEARSTADRPASTPLAAGFPAWGELPPAPDIVIEEADLEDLGQ